MNAIDLFAGLGGWSTGAKMAGVNVIWAANHWQEAVDWHAANHPETQHVCQDLHQARWEDVPAHDLLLASPCCIPEKGRVVMADGQTKAIGDLVLGELVLTHMGRARPVTNIWRKSFSGEMMTLKVSGLPHEPVVMTFDHKVWVNRRGGKYNKFSEPEFMRADQVRPGDYVAFPRMPRSDAAASSYVESMKPGRTAYLAPERTIPSFEKPATGTVLSHVRKSHESSLPGLKVELDGKNIDLWWLVGHYLGDGQSRQDRPDIGWSFGNKDENGKRVASILNSLGLSGWNWGRPGNGAIFTSSTHLHALMTSFGEKAHSKFIPEVVCSFSDDVIEAIIDGYLAADGHARNDRNNPEWRATSVSYPLLTGIQKLCWQLRWSCSLHRQDYARTATIEGREVNCRDSWGISIKKKPHPQSRTKFMGGHVWRSVVSVESETVSRQPVVDIEVDEDHAFCLAEGVVVHNCQGHSKARGKESGNPQHDASRSTAWAVVSAAEFHKPKLVIVENVKEFIDWSLFPAWLLAMQSLGYQLSPHVVDCADLGVPQNRVRIFIVCTLSKHPLMLDLRAETHKPATEFIDFNAGNWSHIDRPGRAAATLQRVESGRAAFGERFVFSYYGNTKIGRDINRPIGTITTRDRWAIVDGDKMRMLSADENLAAMSFPSDTKRPSSHKLTVHMAGNAVPPVAAKRIIQAIKRAA